MDYIFRKILIAFDASENADRAVSYVGEIVGDIPGFQITLLHVVRYPARDRYPSDEEWKNGCEELEKKGELVLQDGINLLCSHGIGRDNITTMIVTAQGASIAGEIMKVQQEGGYGTVVVGRRGVSKAEEFLFGSVSNKVVHYSSNCTVWVVE